MRAIYNLTLVVELALVVGVISVANMRAAVRFAASSSKGVSPAVLGRSPEPRIGPAHELLVLSSRAL